MDFYSPGKLLITGEYSILQGATGLAVKTKFGQTMSAERIDKLIQWDAFDHKGNLWFAAEFDPNSWQTVKSTSLAISGRLKLLLQKCHSQNDKLAGGWKIKTELNFDPSWGLGSSSTLVANLAKWSGVNAYDLLHSSFKGSGYDVAVGMESSSLTFRLINSRPEIQKVNWFPPFYERLFFVHLQKKQDTQAEIKRSSAVEFNPSFQREIDEITRAVLKCDRIDIFEALMQRHEFLMAVALQRPSIQEDLFADFTGTIKSLGAWGGDFILASGGNDEMAYFKERGFKTILQFNEMVDQ